MLRYKLYVFIVMIMSFLNVLATHNRAGEITYEPLSGFTYQVTITTFTNTRPTISGWPPVDRPSLEIDFGDNTTAIVSRTEMIDLPDYYRKNVYRTTHTFPGPGTYVLVVEDPNRNEGVQNIPNSVAVVFSIRTIMQINPALGNNSTPRLLSPPVDKAAKNRIFIHNPAAWDPDGDSLAYKLTPCTGENGAPIPGFEFPSGVSMNEITGDMIWDKPTETGTFNVAILIEEWRQGIKIGQLTRDLQIEVYETDNMPPDIFSAQTICVEAGQLVSVNVKAIDPDGDGVKITPLGGAFELDEPAMFTQTGMSGDTVTGIIEWQTTCNHIRQQPYLLVIKAEDYTSDIVLVDMHNIQIWVNGPATQFIDTESSSTSIFLQWFNPACSVTGYDVYRKTSSYSWVFDECVTGIPSDADYVLIARLPVDSLMFTDTNNGSGLSQGYVYCYRVVPRYGSALGYASGELCVELVRGIPVITNVSIEQTNERTGQVFVAWSKPKEIDTVAHPEPYFYHVFRAEGLGSVSFSNTPVKVLNGLNDTLFIDSLLDTKNKAYSYKVELHNAAGRVSMPMVASSMWLRAKGADKKNTLTIDKLTPWINTNYEFFELQVSGEQLLGEADSATFVHVGLQNQQEYRYRVRSVGQYLQSGFVYPIVNYSQIQVGVPIDSIPPEIPQMTAFADCDAFFNQIEWFVDDPEVAHVNVYYSPDYKHSLVRIKTFPYPDTIMFRHFPELSVSGCYALSSIDLAGNESALSTKICIDSCDFYELPNFITVNEDGTNDVFRPIADDNTIAKTIVKSEVKIYNRWGKLVYNTTNPLILWDGCDKHTKKVVSTGVYYYVCNLQERRISGIEERYKVGFVHVYTNKQ